jgi:uncharacterized membrane protein
MKSKTWLLVFSIIALIIFFIVILYGLTGAPHGEGGGSRSHPVIPTYIISISGIVLIVALIPLFYFIIYSGLERNYEKNMEILSKIVNNNKNNDGEPTSSQEFAKIVLKFLSYNEKKVVNKLIEKKGSTMQSEISRMEGMGKVKTHRAVQDLERKGIISIEKQGNTNRINLTNDIKKIFIK